MQVQVFNMGRVNSQPSDCETPTPVLLTVPEVARLLRTSPKAIYAMHDRRLLPGVIRIGRRLLVKRASLLSWLDQQGASSQTGV